MTGHPTYGIGEPALVYIGDEVSDRADGVPIGVVTSIHVNKDRPIWWPTVAVRHRVGQGNRLYWYLPGQLCLVKRAEP